MFVTWGLGLILILIRGQALWSANWFIVKIAVVLLITLINLFYGKWQIDFAKAKRPLSHVFFRFINEAPFVLMILAVFMVVLEPLF
jgi:putative membrane protein